MARYNNYRKKSYSSRGRKTGRGRTTYGKKFRTKAGRYGSYKYVHGRRVGFVTSNKRSNRTQGQRRRRY